MATLGHVITRGYESILAGHICHNKNVVCFDNVRDDRIHKCQKHPSRLSKQALLVPSVAVSRSRRSKVTSASVIRLSQVSFDFTAVLLMCLICVPIILLLYNAYFTILFYYVIRLDFKPINFTFVYQFLHMDFICDSHMLIYYTE